MLAIFSAADREAFAARHEACAVSQRANDPAVSSLAPQSLGGHPERILRAPNAFGRAFQIRVKTSFNSCCQPARQSRLYLVRQHTLEARERPERSPSGAARGGAAWADALSWPDFF